MKKTGGYDIRPCLVPTYISDLPYDPLTGSNTCLDSTCAEASYDTGYTISQDPLTFRITVCAPAGLEPAISGSEPICLTR
jgi:hypothetical protein